jgi:hypothetical protein
VRSPRAYIGDTLVHAGTLVGVDGDEDRERRALRLRVAGIVCAVVSLGLLGRRTGFGFLLVVVALVTAAVWLLHQLAVRGVRRTARQFPTATFVQRADAEGDGFTRQRAGYLVVDDERITWLTMKGEPSVVARSADVTVAEVRHRGVRRDAGALLTLTTGTETLRFLTFEYTRLRAALSAAGVALT